MERGGESYVDDQVLKALEVLKMACKEIQTNPSAATDGGADSSGGGSSPSMKALLTLETGSEDLLSKDPHLTTLSHLLSRLKSLASSLGCNRFGERVGPIRSFLRRRYSGAEISRVAGSIGTEIQYWIDRESDDRLIAALKSNSADDEERSKTLMALEARLLRGFDSGLQDLLLRSGAFAAVEAALSDPAAPKRVRERASAAVLALVRFNKDVFVGPVLMGPTVRTLVSISSAVTLRVLNGLIAAIRSPIIDEMHSHGEIPKIVGLLGSEDLEVQIVGLETVMEIGYHGRKEAVDAMLEEGLIERLVELQRSELGGALIEMDDASGGGVEAGGVGRGNRERRFMEAHPFASCVARFAIQLEVGDGLRQREKRELKLEVVRRVKAAAAGDAEAATLLAEVLWGSSP